MPLMFLAWGDELLPKSDSFCKDLDKELVLKTDLRSPLTSFDAFLLESYSKLDFSVSNPSKSCYKLRSTELLRVKTEASRADFFTGYWAYF